MQLTRAEGGAEATAVGDCIMGAVDYMEKLHRHDESAIGIQTGYDDLDRCITGLQAGEMFVLAARPSIGKTALALNIAANMALRQEDPVPVGIFSLEMSRELLTLRLLCSEARVNLADIREGAVSRARWTEITEAAGRFREAPICIDDTGNLDIVEMRAKARRMVQKFGTRVFVVDYLQLMKSSAGPNATRENEVAKNSMGIKSLAKELGVPIVVLAQLNRQAEQPGQRPRLSHLRESGAIEQDADVVALLHRERAAEPGEDDNREMEAELIIAKHRNGPTGTVPLTFLKQYTRFESRARFGDADVP
jgi:replicative DNA helicase